MFVVNILAVAGIGTHKNGSRHDATRSIEKPGASPAEMLIASYAAMENNNKRGDQQLVAARGYPHLSYPKEI